MNDIETLNRAGVEKAMIYKDDRDDGLLVYYSYGLMDWYRVDTRCCVDISNYKYWEEC